MPIQPKQLRGALETRAGYSAGIGTQAIFKTRTWVFQPNGNFSFFASSKSGGFYDSGQEKGTYRLDGYTLELHYANGTVSRLPIYAWGDGKQLVIGGRSYSRAAE